VYESVRRIEVGTIDSEADRNPGNVTGTKDIIPPSTNSNTGGVKIPKFLHV